MERIHLKKSLMLVLTVAILLELLTMIIINDMLYANVIEWTIYITLLPLGLVYGVVGMWRGVTTGAVVSNSIFMIVSATLFLLALPHFSYDQGKFLILNRSNNQVDEFRIATSRTVPVSERYSWLLYTREYYYQAKMKGSGKEIFYMVNPVSGRVLSSSKDYWHH